MDDTFTSTQGKQARLEAEQMAATLQNTDEPLPTLKDDEMTREEYWEKVEEEARQRTDSQEGWQNYMNEKALEDLQKTYPGARHVIYGGKPAPMTPERYKRLSEAIAKDRSPRKKAK